VVASLIRRISFENGDSGKSILGEMRLCSTFMEKFSDRVLEYTLAAGPSMLRRFDKEATGQVAKRTVSSRMCSHMVIDLAESMGVDYVLDCDPRSDGEDTYGGYFRDIPSAAPVAELI
jgi:hypothetical protein